MSMGYMLYVYIYPVFFGFPSHLSYHRALSRVPCAIQQVIIICLFYNSIDSVNMSVPISQFILPELPPWQPHVCSLHNCVSISALQVRSSRKQVRMIIKICMLAFLLFLKHQSLCPLTQGLCIYCFIRTVFASCFRQSNGLSSFFLSPLKNHLFKKPQTPKNLSTSPNFYLRFSSLFLITLVTT